VVGGEDVESPVEHEGRGAGHGVDEALDGRPDALTGSTAARRAGTGSGPEQVFQVRSLRVVELQGVREALDHAVGDTGRVAALELGHVLRGDPRQAGDLGAAQPRHPAAISAVHGQPRLLRTDPSPARDEELSDLGADIPTDVAMILSRCHGSTLRLTGARRGSLLVPLSQGLPTVGTRLVP
jgi:hypothetical protein